MRKRIFFHDQGLRFSSLINLHNFYPVYSHFLTFQQNFLDIFFSKWYIVFINWKNLRVLTERVECKPRGVGGLWEPTVWAVFEIFRYWPFFITFRAEIRNTRQTGQYFFQLIIVADRGVNSNRSFSCYAETKGEKQLWDSNQTLKLHRNAKCFQLLRSQRKQVLTTNIWSSTENTKQKSTTIFWKKVIRRTEN